MTNKNEGKLIDPSIAVKNGNFIVLYLKLFVGRFIKKKKLFFFSSFFNLNFYCKRLKQAILFLKNLRKVL